MSAWGKVTKPETTNMSFADIMSEEYAQRVHQAELKKYEQSLIDREKQEEEQALAASLKDDVADREKREEEEAIAAVAQALKDEQPSTSKGDFSDNNDFEALVAAQRELESDEAIALMLQAQFDHEYNEEINRVEQKRNGQSKVSISLQNFRRYGEAYDAYSSEDELPEDDDDARLQRDWDRFETNDKKLDAIPKCGYKVDEEGEMITKHDANLCGVRNACRIMSFPPEFQTGDGAGFDMKLSNRVFNQLKTYSRRGHNSKKNKQQDRKVDVATAEMGVDARTRLLLYKLINNEILEQINGIISTGKEAVILHANSDTTYNGKEHPLGEKLNMLPKECAIKIFKTTLNEFKQRDRYIKDDYRFKDRFSKQNNRVIINMWAEKEMYNMMRMQMAGISCPDVVILKQHVLVMSFIGDNHNAAPKLKDARLSDEEWIAAYTQVVDTMHRLYNEAKLVHADLSEYNILWHDGKCWFIDVAQSVEPEHPSALEFLMRDCNNIITFFGKRAVPDILSKEQLFEHITSLNAENHTTAMLERIHMRGASIMQATAPSLEGCPDELKPLEFPFELAWDTAAAAAQKQQQCGLQEVQVNPPNTLIQVDTKTAAN